MVDSDGFAVVDTAKDHNGSQEHRIMRGLPFKYDIRVTGDLYADSRDNGATTKVSVKIVGNEDGDVVVQQDDSFDDHDSQTSNMESEPRTPQLISRRIRDGGLELHIRALPIRPKTSAPATISGGGASDNGSSGDEVARKTESRTSEAPSRLRTIASYSSVGTTRASTRMSEFGRSRLSSSGHSFMELRPAFEDASVMSDPECAHDDRINTLQSIDMRASPVLVGGGGRVYMESRPRSSSMTKMEDKSTMTTWRGIPDDKRSRNPSRASLATSTTTVNPEEGVETRISSPALSVLRGGGPLRPADDAGVFSAFNGPPVAPPEHRTGNRNGTRGRSFSRDKYALRPRRASKEKVNYRERAERLLTQYFPEELLRKYLDELRRRYRFMGSSGMTSSEILKLIEETTADSQLKEQLRASIEELVKTPLSDASFSDHEQTVSSSPSQRHYLSIRETELRDVLDRTSVSPVPKGVRATTSTGLLVGGGMSSDPISPSSRNFGTITSDNMSIAASVMPTESIRNGKTDSIASSPRIKPVNAGVDLAEIPEAEETPAAELTEEDDFQPQTPLSDVEMTSDHEKKDAKEAPKASNSSHRPYSKSDQSNAQGSNAHSGPQPESRTLDPNYWEDGDKYKMRPPDMRQAFTILKSQPIHIREMSSTDIQFRSPFSRRHEAPKSDASAQKPTRNDSASPGSRAGNSFHAANSFAEKHPTESKVAKAVSELEEVLRRTEAETIAGIESDFNEQSSSSRCYTGQRTDNDAASVVSHDSLVGGGASSRSASASTRISTMESKLDGMRPDSVGKISASQSTIRTDVLLKPGIEFGDADKIESEDTDKEEEEEAAVPVGHGAVNESTISLPMKLDDMPPELASVLRRTGGVGDTKIKRTKSPTSPTSLLSRAGTAARSERDVRLVASRTSSAKASEPAAPSQRSSIRSAATSVAQSTAAPNRSLTELDIVMGRTGGTISRSADSSRASTPSSGGVLRGGSGTPGSPSVANDSENELASVMRRTSGYAPSVSSYAPSIASDNGRPDSSTSDLKSVRAAEAQRRPASTATSLRSNIKMPADGYSSPLPAPRSATRSSAYSARSPAGSVAGSGAKPAAAYASSPLRGPAYQPSVRSTTSPERASQYSRGQQQQYRPQQQQEQQEQQEQESGQRSPSPLLYRLPTPVFGRFPSPPAHIRNRAKANSQEQENGAGPQGDNVQQQEQPGSSRGRPHSHSVGQDVSSTPNRQYPEEPVIDRLDLETGSLASRRSRPRQGSEFGSASTLMSGGASEGFNLPKVVEEDIDSLASYPNSSRSRSPAVLVGGGRVDSDAAASETRAPSTLRGGGRLHPAFTNSDPSAPSKRCETGCCGVCGQGVEKDDIVVRPQVMHASCLRCEACDCLLTSSTFRAVDGHVYCEKDYKKYFVNREGTHSSPNPKVVAVRPGVSDKKFEEMNRAIMESFTSVDDFLAHMRQLREKHDRKDGELAKASSGDQSQVRRAGDVGVDRQTHYEREQVTSPSGTPWITERVVDKKVKTKVLEKRYPASAIDPCETPASIKSRLSAPAAVHANESKTLIGGGGRPASNASRPSTSLLNDTTSLNGWDHPLCPVCNAVVYLNDRVTHEGYGYHKACMRCRQCSQVVPVTSAIRIKGAIYCKKHGNDLLRRRSILMRKKSTMGRRSRHNRRRSGVSRERFTVESGDAVPAVPPVPDMPMFSSGNGNSSNLPVPSIPHESGAPRRVTTALRHFLEAAAEQIENNSLMPVTPEPIGRSMTGPSTPVSQQPRATSISSEQQRRPLPVPKPKPGQLDYQAQKQQQKQQQEQVQQRPPYSLPSSPPQSPPPSGQRTGSRSIFSGSRDSLYDPNVVNALRQEAQRQINGSQASISGSRHSSASSHDMSHRMLSPCGPSIVDILHFGSNSRQDQMNASSQFDPFADSHEQLSGGGFASPQGRIGGAFSPNAQLDNLERRFRNANFRPPWALKSQTMFE